MAGNLDTPYSRREIFYKGILDQDPDSLPDPETREERYLKAIAEAYPTPVEATVTQDEGSSTTSVMSQKAVTDALDDLRDSKLDKTGTASLADNLTPYSADSGATQSVPFINQGTGCGNGESIVDTGSYAQIKKKLGNTVGVNQLVNPGTYTSNGVTATYDTTTKTWKFSGTAGSTYFQFGGQMGVAGRYYISNWRIVKNPNNVSVDGFRQLNGIDGWTKLTSGSSTRWRSNGRGYFGADGLTIGQSWDGVEVEVHCSDLAIWFGSNEAIPSYLLSHPEDWGRYYAGSLDYNAGTLDSADGSVLTSIGRNLFDKSTAVANERWKASGTEYASGSTRSDYIPCIPNITYYFKDIQSTTTLGSGIYWFDADKNYISAVALNITSGTATAPSNARYMGINLPSTSLDTCCVSLYYPDESGYDQYYPFSVLAEVDTGSEVLRSAGSVADEKTPDGTITRRIGVVDLGTLTWTKATYSGVVNFYAAITNGAKSGDATQKSAKCSKYTQSISIYPANMPDKSFTFGDAYVNSNANIRIVDSAYSGSGVDAFKTAMSGVYLYYELATPTTEQGTPFSGASADNFAIDDFGSMYWTQTNGVPQGVEIFYPYDYKAAVDTLLNMVDGDVEKLVTETELGAVADRIPEAPAEDGTYTLKATVASGVKTYAWVADE